MILWEETKITDQKQLVSDCKKVFEGSSIKCNKKHQDGFWLERTPILCTSNYTPWEYVKDERITFENRMFYLTFYEDARLEPLVKHLNPFFWVEILEKGRDYLPGTPHMSDLLSGLVEELNTLPETELFQSNIQQYIHIHVFRYVRVYSKHHLGHNRIFSCSPSILPLVYIAT